ncbi:nicotinate-nucleotide adenylyltransferase [Agaricicola taiwanensis]|nr:nicotinate-nucleotide adenylyltransferase [Agaricicola taiwanensis]
MVVGLYGGSFNPPHAGHLHVSRLALARLGLDRLWWLVTPGNPLKARSELSPLSERMAAATRLATDPRIVVTDIEARLGFTYSIDTLAWLKAKAASVRFVWIMGADSLASFHRWRRWRAIMEQVPIAVIDRPGWTLKATSAPAALAMAQYRLPEADARLLAGLQPPAWTLIHGPRSPLSSTALRAKAAAASKKG